MSKQSRKAVAAQPVEAAPKPEFVPRLFISGVNTPVCVQLLIDKPSFTLGKGDGCDGVLAFNGVTAQDTAAIEASLKAILQVHAENVPS